MGEAVGALLHVGAHLSVRGAWVSQPRLPQDLGTVLTLRYWGLLVYHPRALLLAVGKTAAGLTSQCHLA